MADRLAKGRMRLAAATVLLLAGSACSPPAPVEPPPPSEVEAPEPPPLMGGPQEPEPRDLAQAPDRETPPPIEPQDTERRDGVVTFRRADGVLVTAMRPIPNPGDGLAGGPPAPAEAPAASVAPAESKTAPPAGPPAAATPRTTNATPNAPPLATVTPMPAPKTARPPVKAAKAPPPPAAPLAQPPPTPFVQAMALAPPTDPKLAALQSALAADVAAGAKLSAPEAVWSGRPARVSLGLPPGLLAMIRHEAGRAGLARAAQTVEVSARLVGPGYAIAPAAPQVVKLEPGRSAGLEWQVTAPPPAAGEHRPPLRAEVEARLTGAGAPAAFALTALEQPAPSPPAAETRPSAAAAVARPVVIAIVAVLVLMALLGLWRNLAARRAQEAHLRREAARRSSDYTLGAAPPPADAPAQREPAPVG